MSTPTTTDADDADAAAMMEWQPPSSDAEIIDGSKTTLRATARALPRLLVLALRLGRQADRTALITLLACAAASAAASGFGLLATTGMITHLVADNAPIADRLARSVPSVAFLAAMSGTAAVLRIVGEWVADRIGPKIARAAELELIDAATHAEVVAYDNPKFQAAWDAADRGAGSTRDLLSQTRDVIGYTANLVAAGIVIATIHPVLLPLLVLAVIPQALARTAAANAFYRAMMATFGATRAANVLRWFLCDRRCAAEVRSNTISPFLLRIYRRAAARVTDATDATAGRSAVLGLYGAAASGIGAFLVWGGLAWLLASGHVTLASAGTAVIALRSAAADLHSAANYSAAVHRTGLYVGDWRSFIEMARAQRLDRGVAAPPAGTAVIEARNVTFTYPGSERPALRGVDFTVRRGEIVAVVGVNGAAKSTLMKLLCGLTLPDAGTVSWDGVSTRDMAPDLLWRQTALVQQDFSHWPLTVRQNITLGQPTGRGDAAVLEAAAATGADEVIAELASGLDTLLAKEFWGGAEISEGQWQRVVTAAAFHRAQSGTLLILDEPTGAMDPRAEHRIFNGLAEIAKDCATVLVTHNLENTKVAHRIVVLDHGLVIQEGSFEELAGAPGMFADLRALQHDRGRQLPAQRTDRSTT
ncbi:ABC transporter ATP-binding protein [Kitasatospora sp. RG8]|uniref:ATP-binding cassette domain-containing protein n=1 Tax=Kitasatospora sp. RG8 TaxID=2820815 RepID=UPI002111CBA1|nr:ABC transporter ATP-binding protein [Kitasatospora sp. RG8]